MDLLDGVPTIVGGFNADSGTFNEALYQYDLELRDWVRVPSVSMRVPRSDAAVFQVPRSLVDGC